MSVTDITNVITWSFILFFALYCLIGIVMLLGTVFWIWTIIDCTTKEPAQGNDKFIWLLVIIFTHFVGSLVYFFVRRPERKKMFGH